MQYFTKDYYQDGFVENTNLVFQGDERARVFSNELFESLMEKRTGPYDPLMRNKKQIEYLRHFRNDCLKILFVFPQYISRLMSAEEIASVPDIRILGMGIASPETAALLNDRIKILRQQREKAAGSYKEYLENNPKANKCYELFSRQWCLHDYLVVDCIENHGMIELKLRLDKKIKTSLILSDAHIIMQESTPVDKYILDTEIYFEDNTYTICFLIGDRYNNLYYFDISAKAIEFR